MEPRQNESEKVVDLSSFYLLKNKKKKEKRGKSREERWRKYLFVTPIPNGSWATNEVIRNDVRAASVWPTSFIVLLVRLPEPANNLYHGFDPAERIIRKVSSACSGEHTSCVANDRITWVSPNSMSQFQAVLLVNLLLHLSYSFIPHPTA